MKRLLFIILFFNLSPVFSQFNVSLLSHIDYQALHNANLNDVWGYADGAGNEYAIVGTTKGTSIVDVTNSSNPVEVFWMPGTESIWRDPCVYGDYAYITTEAEDGLLIIDLSPLPASTSLPTSMYTGSVTSAWQSAHTCFIDENGFAYIFGANRGNGGAIILDVHTDPMNPTEVGVFDNWYVHDGCVRNDTMYLAHILDGFFSLVDVSDKANPVLLGTKTTPNNFSHNIWPSTTGHYVFTTDEVSGAFIAAYDISNPTNIVEVDRTQWDPGAGLIPHNAHVKGNFLITSYYSEGIIIHDITHPYNMIEVGQFDTYPGETTGFDGCWGVYPFLPSGIFLASDMTEGLFILGPTLIQGSYLEGTITDANTSAPLSNVQAMITVNDQADHSQSNGHYATGIEGAGVYDVTYSKVGYFSQTISVNLFPGVITTQDVQLVPIPPYNLTVNVVESGTLNPVSGAQIMLAVPLIDHAGISNGIGQENFVLYYQENYMITVAKWGYLTTCYEQLIDQNTGVLTIVLEKGYQDEFTFDLGWITSGTATSGMWERGKPNGSNSGSAPNVDADYDCSSNAYVTGNDAVLNPDLDDVDGGFTLLISPTLDLSTYTEPYLNYARWFHCMHGATPEDTLKVILSNGFTSVTIDEIGGLNGNPTWESRSIRIEDYITLTNSMQLSFRISDLDPDVNITEGGVDYIYISEGSVLDLENQEVKELKIVPNPFMSDFSVLNAKIGAEYVLYTSQGIEIEKGIFSSSQQKFDMKELPSGIYFIKVGVVTMKVMKV